MAKQPEKTTGKSTKAAAEKPSKVSAKDTAKASASAKTVPTKEVKKDTQKVTKLAAKAAAGATAAVEVADEPEEITKPRVLMPALFTQQELDVFRNLLKEEKRKLLAKAKQAMQSGGITLDKDEMYDEVDLASATVEQNLTFRLLDRDRKLLSEIEHALFKIDSGEYGYCEGTGEAIPKRRLELRPWTRHSVKFKEQLEKMKKSGRGVADEFEESEDEM